MASSVWFLVASLFLFFLFFIFIWRDTIQQWSTILKLPCIVSIRNSCCYWWAHYVNWEFGRPRSEKLTLSSGVSYKASTIQFGLIAFVCSCCCEGIGAFSGRAIRLSILPAQLSPRYSCFSPLRKKGDDNNISVGHLLLSTTNHLWYCYQAMLKTNIHISLQREKPPINEAVSHDVPLNMLRCYFIKARFMDVTISEEVCSLWITIICMWTNFRWQPPFFIGLFSSRNLSRTSSLMNDKKTHLYHKSIFIYGQQIDALWYFMSYRFKVLSLSAG